jgi:hypothetical protein
MKKKSQYSKAQIAVLKCYETLLEEFPAGDERILNVTYLLEQAFNECE